MLKLRLQLLLPSVGMMSVATLAVMLGLILFPVNLRASALENTRAVSESRVVVKAAASVSVRLDSEIEMDVTPKANGVFTTNYATLGVSTNNVEGYKVFLSAGDGDTALRDASTERTIGSITQDTVGTDFVGNTWGWTLSDKLVDETVNSINEHSTFHAVPGTDSVIHETTQASAGGEDVYHLGFGTHLGTDLPAGEYSNVVLVSVVANPTTISSLNQLVYMQDMQASFCTNARVGDSKRLIDVRDGKGYWVEKLADGNCWMTQNLALDLTTAGLSTADSDVTSNWNQSSTYKPVATEMAIPAKVTTPPATTTRSWDLGKYVLATPLGGDVCSLSAGQSLSQCKTTFVDVSGDNWQPTGTVAKGEWNGEEQLVAVFPADANDLSKGGTYDAHYLIGNLYQFNAATAGTGGDAAGGEAANSICPKGWKLPMAGTNEARGTFYNLFTQYGFTFTKSTSPVGRYYNGALESTKDGITYNAATEPFYLTRAGIIYLPGDNSVGAVFTSGGSAGYFASSTRFNSSNYQHNYLASISGSLAASWNEARHNGSSVRCLAR